MTTDLTEDAAMNRTFLRLTLILLFTIGFTGCSLFSSGDEEQETATVSEEQVDKNDDEFASDDFEAGDDTDASFGESFDSQALAEGQAPGDTLGAEDVEVEDNFGVAADEYPDDDYGSGDPLNVAAADGDGFSQEETVSVDEGGGLPDSTMTNNQEDDLFGGDQGPVVDTPLFEDDSFTESDYGQTAQKFVPVKKMKPAAYKRAGANINRLYVVRSGDTMTSIAEKLYGSDRSEDLYKYNSHFRGKTLQVGDKVYYESPNNSNDQTMLTYYEDNNMAPQYYTSADGDNIRAISKKLLGHKRSWMEVYATNEGVESKGRLPAGLVLRYWPEGSLAAPVAVVDTSSEPVPSAEPAMEEVQEVAMEAPPVEVVDPMASEPDNMDDMQAMGEPQPMAEPDMMGEEEDFSPPPVVGSVGQPPKAIAPPPPPPPAPTARFNKPPEPKPMMADESPMGEMGDDSTIMAALGGLLILAFIIMLIFIRRSRSKRVNFSQTQA